jgi:hypothetical protein
MLHETLRQKKLPHLPAVLSYILKMPRSNLGNDIYRFLVVTVKFLVSKLSQRRFLSFIHHPR